MEFLRSALYPCTKTDHAQPLVLKNINVILSDEVKKVILANVQPQDLSSTSYVFLHCDLTTGAIIPYSELRDLGRSPNLTVKVSEPTRGEGKLYYIYCEQGASRFCVRNLVNTELKLNDSSTTVRNLWESSVKDKVARIKEHKGFNEAWKWNYEYACTSAGSKGCYGFFELYYSGFKLGALR